MAHVARAGWLTGCAVAVALAGPSESVNGRQSKPDAPAKKTPEQRLLEELKGQGLILFTRYRNSRRWDIQVMNADGSDVRSLTRTGDRHEHLPVAPADGGPVFYVRMPAINPNQKLLPFRNFAHLPWQWEGHLWATDRNGRNHRAILFGDGPHRARVTEATGLAAPNAGTVVYGGAWDERISVLDVKSGRVRAYHVIGQPRHLSVSPAMRYAWYASPGAGWHLYRLDLRTGKVEEMGGRDFMWPAISHDGTRLVHCVENRPDLTGGLDERCLVIRDAPSGRNLRFLLGEKGLMYACPTFSPDDRYLAYCVRRGKKPWAMRITRLSDMVTTGIPAPSHPIDPCWIQPGTATTRPATTEGSKK